MNVAPAMRIMTIRKRTAVPEVTAALAQRLAVAAAAEVQQEVGQEWRRTDVPTRNTIKCLNRSQSWMAWKPRLQSNNLYLRSPPPPTSQSRTTTFTRKSNASMNVTYLIISSCSEPKKHSTVLWRASKRVRARKTKSDVVLTPPSEWRSPSSKDFYFEFMKCSVCCNKIRIFNKISDQKFGCYSDESLLQAFDKVDGFQQPHRNDGGFDRESVHTKYANHAQSSIQQTQWCKCLPGDGVGVGVNRHLTPCPST